MYADIETLCVLIVHGLYRYRHYVRVDLVSLAVSRYKVVCLPIVFLLLVVRELEFVLKISIFL